MCVCGIVWQDGTDGEDAIYGATMGQDGAAVLVGLWSSNFSAVKLDAEGEVLWEWQVTSCCFSIAHQVKR